MKKIEDLPRSLLVFNEEPLTNRDLIAAVCLHGFIVSGKFSSPEYNANWAIHQADELISQLKTKQKNKQK